MENNNNEDQEELGFYFEKAADKFTDLVEDEDFKTDLVKFFTSGRYSYSDEELNKKGYEGLAKDFVEHMRVSNASEVTLLKDWNFVRSDNYDQDAKDAFGRLMFAYDNSADGGTTGLTKIFDYLEGVASSPTTWATVFTGGFGAGSKVAARGASAATQAAIRKTLLGSVSRTATRQAATRTIKNAVAANQLRKEALTVLPVSSIKREVARTALTSAAIEGAIEAPMSSLYHNVRSQAIDNYEYGFGDIAKDVTIAAAFGGGLGSVAGYVNAAKHQKSFDLLIEGSQAQAKRAAATRKAANATIKSSPEEATGIIQNFVNSLPALDPDLVKAGDDILADITKRVEKGQGVDQLLSSRGLSLDTIRSTTAFVIDMRRGAGVEDFTFDPNLRVTENMARLIEDKGAMGVEVLEKLRKKYGLTKEELGLIWRSEFSTAGKVLAQARKLKRSEDLTKLLTRAQTINQSGVAIVPSDVLAQAEKAAKEGRNVGSLFYRFAQESDSASIGMMTTQLGTTFANAFSSTLTVALDVSDNANLALIRALKTGDFRNSGKGILSVLKGLTVSRREADMLASIFAMDAPEEFARTFYRTARFDKALDYDSVVGRLVRKANMFNSAVDYVFKKAVVYGEMDRYLKSLDPADAARFGSSVDDFLRKGLDINSLPKDIVDNALESSKRITMQRNYTGDASAFGKTARMVEDLNKKLPFVVSQGLGLPFPRFMANQIEYIADYTGAGIGYDALSNINNFIFGSKFVGDSLKTPSVRLARGMSGMYLLGGMMALDRLQPEGTDINSLVFTGGEEAGGVDISRVGGLLTGFRFLARVINDHIDGKENPDTWGDFALKFAEQSTSLTDLGWQGGVAGDIVTYLQSSNPEEKFRIQQSIQKSAGNWVSTFTYPAMIARDVYGQLEPQAAGTPFTADVTGRNLLFDFSKSGQFYQQATRFLPDIANLESWGMFRTSTSGERDIKSYANWASPFPTGGYNPITKQFGLESKPAKTDLTKELADLRMEPFDLRTFVYGSATYANPVSRPLIDEIMAKTFSDYFTFAKRELKAVDGRSYDQLNTREKRKFIEDQTVSYFNEVSNTVDSFLQAAMNAEETLDGTKKGRVTRQVATAYMMNSYRVEMNRIEKDHKGLTAEVVQDVTGGVFTDPEDYFNQAFEDYGVNAFEVAMNRRLEVLTRMSQAAEARETDRAPAVIGVR